jgi:predicted nucleotidyltransferase
MQPHLPPLIQRTLRRLVRSYSPERIVLFGSFAKGTAHAGSDYDLLVIANVGENRALHLRRARQLASDCFPPVDVVFATPQEVAEAHTARSPFLLSILGRGITVYCAPQV